MTKYDSGRISVKHVVKCQFEGYEFRTNFYLSAYKKKKMNAFIFLLQSKIHNESCVKRSNVRDLPEQFYPHESK